MEDGQVTGEFAEDRAEEDPEDLEYHGILSESETGSDNNSSDETVQDDNDDEEDEADEAAPVGAPEAGATVQGGTRTTSLEQFLADWTDDDGDSAVGDSTADPHRKPPRAPA